MAFLLTAVWALQKRHYIPNCGILRCRTLGCHGRLALPQVPASQEQREQTDPVHGSSYKFATRRFAPENKDTHSSRPRSEKPLLVVFSSTLDVHVQNA